METGLLRGLAVFRWAAWVWIAAVTFINRDHLRRPVLAWVLIGAALAITAWLTALVRRDPAAMLHRVPVAVELACGAALILCDGWAYGRGHAFATSQSLGVGWPVAGVLTVGIAWGPAAGGLAGVGMGLARFGATLANGVALSSLAGARVTSLVSTAVLYASAGAVAGYVATLLRRAERQISAARAREEMARTLHDGVLQTLAVVRRRTTLFARLACADRSGTCASTSSERWARLSAPVAIWEAPSVQPPAGSRTASAVGCRSSSPTTYRHSGPRQSTRSPERSEKH